jgi:hypothetical protein
LFALDQLKLLGPQHPQWQSQETFASLLRVDHNATLAGGEPAKHQIIMASHAGMTTEEVASIVKTVKVEIRNTGVDLRKHACHALSL